MARVHNDLLICVLYNDTENSSDCLMSNVWLMGEDLFGGRKYKGCIISLDYKTEICGFDFRWCLWSFSL